MTLEIKTTVVREVITTQKTMKIVVVIPHPHNKYPREIKTGRMLMGIGFAGEARSIKSYLPIIKPLTNHFMKFIW